MEKKSVAVSENAIGVSGTTLFKLPSMDKDTTLLTFYDVVGGGKDKGGPVGTNGGLWQQFFLQFITKYTTGDGEQRCRVTTVTRRYIWGWWCFVVVNIMCAWVKDTCTHKHTTTPLTGLWMAAV